jgi:AraC family transcriptional regulator, melibiose operon regulatory protein
MVSFDPNRPDFSPYGLTCVRWSPSPMRRPDHHNEIELNLLQSGWVTYLLGGRKVKIQPGRVSVFWAAIPHQIIDYGDEPDYFVATIPFAWFLQCKLPDGFVQPLLRGEVVSEPDAARSSFDCRLFENWVQDLRKPDDDLRQCVLLEMHARLVRLARCQALAERPSPAPGRRKASLNEGGLNKVEQMACLIARRYLEKLSVEDIGKAVGLHPNYAMNLFKRTFGTTLVDYLTHHRVSHAQRLLATTDQKIVEVALESGFNSISRFNEAFRRACGCTPRDYRQRHQTVT